MLLKRCLAFDLLVQFTHFQPCRDGVYIRPTGAQRARGFELNSGEGNCFI